MKLHYNLDFLRVGQPWPAEVDVHRLHMYKFAREQFELTPEDLVHDLVPEGLMRFGSFDEFAHAVKLLGYPRLLTLKTTDMLVGQPPSIAAQGKKQTKVTEKIRDLRATCNFNGILKQMLIDYSRFGVGLLRVFKDEKKQPNIAAWDPHDWVPVFYPDGTNRIHYNVIGWEYNNTLTVQVHDTKDGSYEERYFSIDNAHKIVRDNGSKFYNRSSGVRLLYSIINTPTTTNPIGTNDYEIINGLLQKAIQRLQAILRVLDEHADPSLVGPSTLLTKSEGGEVVFKTSRYYAIGDDEKKPEYLVWEANLESSFKAFDELCKQIYVLSEMGEAFLGSSAGVGNVVSGTAMRMKMISPLEKARRISNEITEPLKAAISALLSLQGDKVEAKNINITWKDSLPKDPREVAELAELEAGSIAIKPLLNAIMDNYNADLETAQGYVDDILAFQKQQAEIGATVSEDGREHGATGSVDARSKGSEMDPASSENKGDDEKAKLK